MLGRPPLVTSMYCALREDQRFTEVPWYALRVRRLADILQGVENPYEAAVLAIMVAHVPDQHSVRHEMRRPERKAVLSFDHLFIVDPHGIHEGSGARSREWTLAERNWACPFTQFTGIQQRDLSALVGFGNRPSARVSRNVTFSSQIRDN